MKNETRKQRVDLVEQARQLRLQAEELEKKLASAKGSRDVVKRPVITHVVPRNGQNGYYVGDEGPTDELVEVIYRMLCERPCTFRDILAETGARDNRIKGAITRLQREGARVVNLGNEYKALWFIPDDAVMARIMRVKKNATVLK